MQDGSYRRCSTCGEEKPPEGFRPGKKQCKECLRAREQEYRDKNREKIRAAGLAHYHRDAERYKAQHRERSKDPKVQAAKRAYAAANKGRDAATQKAWQAANPERAREKKRAWAERNQESVRRLRREGMARRKALLPLTNYSTADPEARAYMNVLRCDPCSYCGAPAGTVDHIDPLGTPGADDLLNLTSACKRCNSAKGQRTLLHFLLDRG